MDDCGTQGEHLPSDDQWFELVWQLSYSSCSLVGDSVCLHFIKYSQTGRMVFRVEYMG